MVVNYFCKLYLIKLILSIENNFKNGSNLSAKNGISCAVKVDYYLFVLVGGLEKGRLVR